MFVTRLILSVIAATLIASQTLEQSADHSRAVDVVYGHRDGMALTMDAFTPKKPNGAGVIIFVSAGFRSNRDLLELFHPGGTTPFLDRRYTVFTVMHASQPRYTVPEIVEDAHRAVRFIKHNAKKYGIDPEKIGVAGGSAGGHLSLMMGCAGKPGDPNAADPVDRVSSKAAAVACFFPPTDFLAFKEPHPTEFNSLFDVREFDATTGKYVAVPPARLRQIGRDMSPINHVAKNSSPALIIHGDKDTLVPMSQSKAMIAKLKECGVACELVVKPGKCHMWFGINKDVPALADWFDKHL